MKSFVFASSNDYTLNDFDSLLTFDAKCDEFFEVVLNDDNELAQLLELLNIKKASEINLPNSEDFAMLIDFSNSLLPNYTTDEFDLFYEHWLQKTGRESDMDEYGQLIFIQGQAEKWNKNNKRFLLKAVI